MLPFLCQPPVSHKVVGPSNELNVEHQDQLLRQFADQHRAHEARIEAMLERHQHAMDEAVERVLGRHTLLCNRPRSPGRKSSKGSKESRLKAEQHLGHPQWHVGFADEEPPDAQAHFVFASSDPLAGLQSKIMHAEGLGEGSYTSEMSSASSSDDRHHRPPRNPGEASVSASRRSSHKNSAASLAAGEECVVSALSVQSKKSMQELDETVEKAEACLQHRRYSIGVPDSGESFSRRALAICQSPIFEWSVGLVILANAVIIGATTQWSFQHIGQNLPWWMEVLNLAFLLIFALEILLRLMAEGRTFLNFRTGNGYWNAFDLVLITMSVVDTVIGMFDSPASSATIVRMLRIARLFHTMRIIRIARFFDDLRLLVVGIWNCGKTLLWSAGLLIMIMYIYGICIMQVLTFGWADGSVRNMAEEEVLLDAYGTVSKTIYTLFKALLGGVSWGEVADPLQKVSPLLLLAFSSYIAFAMTCVLNIITGIFVDKAKHFQSDDKLISDYVEGYKRRVDSIRLLFQMHDSDKSGSIDFDEFSKAFYDLSAQAYFESLGVQVSEMTAEQVFELLDEDRDGVVSIDEFAMGIANLKGLARKIDMNYLLQVSQEILVELEDLHRAVRDDVKAAAAGNARCHTR